MIRKSLLAVATASVLPGVAQAQYIGGSAPPPPAAPAYGLRESPEASLSRHVRLLAINPRNYEALLGAGRAALALGDTQAAVGFFGRAEEVNPRSWVPKWGQGAALVQMEDPQAALQAFSAAQALGATQVSVALDRGLAFDLTGDQARAQADYRAALNGPDANEARRRLALSLAISGNKTEALKTLDPLLARRDPGASRCRAFVLALTGDVEGARSAVNAALPGLAGNLDPFLRRLPALRPAEKAAAVNFGHMPGAGGGQVAGVLPSGPRADRLADLDSILNSGAPVASPPVAARPSAPTWSPPQPVRVATVVPTPSTAIRPTPPPSAAPAAGTGFSLKRFWVQLASGNNADALNDQFRRLKLRNRDLLKNINGYVAEEPAKARLLIGPFKSVDDARIFADDLESIDVDAFSWTSAPGQMIRKLPDQ
ncbi:tetratricopeptide repeat protein [Sphingomonas sp. GCM10030256]|uniref:tetratricopeptide repeat protein n=1 Tax=Sphingomonas sp. GCM10030256 TaxID=3273427 RepID=UPI003615E1D4